MKFALVVWFFAWGQPSTQTTYVNSMEHCIHLGHIVAATATPRKRIVGIECKQLGRKTPVFNVIEQKV